jgi:methyl-accepting chemotaxis protein
MADDDKIKYSDIIQPDDSIERLIQQLERLTSTYESMLEGVRAGANKMSQSLKQASGATSEGRAAIEETAAATKRLKKVQEEFEP